MTPAEAQAHLHELLADAERAADQARDRERLCAQAELYARTATDASLARVGRAQGAQDAAEFEARAQALDMAIGALGRA